MNIKNFGNAFKQAVAEKLANKELSQERAERIYPRKKKDNKVDGSKEMLKQDYIYPNAVNVLRGSVVIDSWYAIFNGNRDIKEDDNDTLLPGGGNPFGVKLKAAGDSGNIQLPNDINITVNHGGMDKKVDLRDGENENWRNIDWLLRNDEVKIGYLLGLLFARGYEAGEIRLDTDNNLVAADHKGNDIPGGYTGLLLFPKESDWIDNFGRVLQHTTGGGYGEFVWGGLTADNGMNKTKMKSWLIRQIEVGILPDNRLTPIQCHELYRLGYEPKDLFNGADTVGGATIGTAGQVYAYDPVAGRWLAGFAEIEPSHKLAKWFNSCKRDVTTPTYIPVSTFGSSPFVREKLSFNSRDFRIMFNWLKHQEENGLVYGANRLTGAQVQELHKLGWDPQDLKKNGGDWQAVNPANGDRLNRINAILAVGKLKDWRDAVENAASTISVPGGRFPLRGIILDFGGSKNYSKIDNWLEVRTEKNISPANLTPENIQYLYQLGWDHWEIEVAETDNFTVINPLTKQPLAQIGYAAISALGPKSNYLWDGISATDHVARPLESHRQPLTYERDQILIESWLAKRKQLIDAHPTHQKTKIETELSIGNIKALHLENWDPDDISWDAGAGATGALKIENPATRTPHTAENFAGISALGGKIKLWRDGFRAAVSAAHGAGRSSAHEDLKKDDSENNFIIDQYLPEYYGSPLTAQDAVVAYNNGWIYGSEITWSSDKKNRRITYNGGKDWVISDWSTNSREVYLKTINPQERELMNAFQVDDTGTRWNPPLSDTEKSKIKNNFSSISLILKSIRLGRFRTEFRKLATGQAATDLKLEPVSFGFGGGNDERNRNNERDFIIDQFNHDKITPAEAVAAYNCGWIFGLELRKNSGQTQYCFADENWKNTGWTTIPRNNLLNLLSPDRKAKTLALQVNGSGKRWNPALSDTEITQIKNATNLSATVKAIIDQRDIAKKKKEFIFDFRRITGWNFGGPLTPSDSDILTYFGKNLTGEQAAQLYKGDPRVLGSELSKGENSNEVIFNEKVYKIVGDIVGTIIAAKKAEIEAEEAAAEAARQAAELTEFQNAAENAIKTAQQATDNKTEITDTELNQYLKETEKVLNDNLKTWQEYLKVSTKPEVKSRKSKILTAITVIRKIKRSLAAARTKAINSVKNYWKNKSNNKSETGTVNGKKMSEVLGLEWEKEFDKKNSSAEIEDLKKGLITKINTEKSQEKSKKPAQKLTTQKIVEIFQNVLHDTSLKINPEMVKSWQVFNNAKSELKTPQQIKKFIQEVKNTEFVKFLTELPETDRPTRQSDKEKLTNFLTNKKAEIVIKTILGYKLKNQNFQTKIEIEMENEQNEEEQPLDEEVYPQKNGKYTREAMIRFLYEKKTGQTHKFSTAEEEWEENDLDTPNEKKEHWEKWKNWYIGGGIIVLLVAGLVAAFWKNLSGRVKKGDKKNRTEPKIKKTSRGRS